MIASAPNKPKIPVSGHPDGVQPTLHAEDSPRRGRKLATNAHRAHALCELSAHFPGRAARCAHTTMTGATTAELIGCSRAQTLHPHKLHAVLTRSHHTWLRRARATADAGSKARRAAARGGALTKVVYLDHRLRRLPKLRRHLV